MTKAELRLLYKQKRATECSPESVTKGSKEITDKVLQYFTFQKEDYISLFFTIAGKQEIETAFLCERLLENQCRVCASKSDFETQTMQHFVYENPTQLQLSKFGIPEPTHGKLVSPEKMDFVFVPLLAFDKKGFRVGYGKGFYDRFLAQCRKNCTIIGLSFFEAIDTIDDCDKFDIPLDFCVTPQQVYQFKTDK